MNSALLTIQLLVLLAAAIVAKPNKHSGNDEDTLVLLHVLFRHGNRTPDKASLFPNDIHLNETYEPIGYSQLTPKGKRTEFEIGRYIRATYDNLIPEQYTPNVAYAISTNTKRTKMSLELVLSGLFPPQKGDVFVPGLDWQPLPFNIEPGQGELGVALAYCASYISQYYQYLMSKEVREISAGYADIFQELSELTGLDITLPKDVGSVYFSFKSEEDYGLSLPDWAPKYYPDLVQEIYAIDYECATATPSLTKLSAGFLLRKILEDSVAKRDGTLDEERKIFLYSAHEYNVATMLRALNVFYRHVPPFGATIFFEIHNVDGVFGLKLFYQNYAEDRPIPLTIPGCDSFCPLDQVYELLQDSIAGDSDICVPTTELM